MRLRLLKVLHFLWRHAWGIYEVHPSRVTRWTFNALDSAHNRHAYPGGSQLCACRRF